MEISPLFASAAALYPFQNSNEPFLDALTISSSPFISYIPPIISETCFADVMAATSAARCISRFFCLYSPASLAEMASALSYSTGSNRPALPAASDDISEHIEENVLRLSSPSFPFRSSISFFADW